MHIFLHDEWSQLGTVCDLSSEIRTENWPGRLSACSTFYYASDSSRRIEGTCVLWFLQANCSESGPLAYPMTVGKNPGKKDHLGAGEMAHWEEGLLSCPHSVSSAHIRLLRAAQRELQLQLQLQKDPTPSLRAPVLLCSCAHRETSIIHIFHK